MHTHSDQRHAQCATQDFTSQKNTLGSQAGNSLFQRCNSSLLPRHAGVSSMTQEQQELCKALDVPVV